jgi:hypothetical protein
MSYTGSKDQTANMNYPLRKIVALEPDSRFPQRAAEVLSCGHTYALLCSRNCWHTARRCFSCYEAMPPPPEPDLSRFAANPRDNLRVV